MPNVVYNMAPMIDPKKIAEALGAEHVGHVETRGGALGAAQTVADVHGLRGRVPAPAAVAEYAQAFGAWDDATMRWLRQRDELMSDKRVASDVWTLEPGHESELLERVRRTWAALSTDEQRAVELAVDVPALRLGVYVHHGGGEYTVTGLIWHHETQRPMVKYISHKYGKENARALRGWPKIDEDGWNECVQKEGLLVPRFRLMKLHPAALSRP
jgi:hypothetical protein